jgi:hypothetical protein
VRPEDLAGQLATGARAELAKLRAAATRSDGDRLHALRVAGRWLSDAVTQLRVAAPTDPTLAGYADLATELLGTGEATPQLWARAEAALLALAGEPAEPRRRPFWKR